LQRLSNRIQAVVLPGRGKVAGNNEKRPRGMIRERFQENSTGIAPVLFMPILWLDFSSARA
jgi:hypothetical protein